MPIATPLRVGGKGSRSVVHQDQVGRVQTTLRGTGQLFTNFRTLNGHLGVTIVVVVSSSGGGV
eukprot:scaffold2880_cov173-Amphora_coffeaeformis.AAC.1